MGVDLATQAARASATVILTILNRINSVPARQRLTHTEAIYDKPIASSATLTNLNKNITQNPLGTDTMGTTKQSRRNRVHIWWDTLRLKIGT